MTLSCLCSASRRDQGWLKKKQSCFPFVFFTRKIECVLSFPMIFTVFAGSFRNVSLKFRCFDHKTKDEKTRKIDYTKNKNIFKNWNSHLSDEYNLISRSNPPLGHISRWWIIFLIINQTHQLGRRNQPIEKWSNVAFRSLVPVDSSIITSGEVKSYSGAFQWQHTPGQESHQSS